MKLAISHILSAYKVWGNSNGGVQIPNQKSVFVIPKAINQSCKPKAKNTRDVNQKMIKNPYP